MLKSCNENYSENSKKDIVKKEKKWISSIIVLASEFPNVDLVQEFEAGKIKDKQWVEESVTRCINSDASWKTQVSQLQLSPKTARESLKALIPWKSYLTLNLKVPYFVFYICEYD